MSTASVQIDFAMPSCRGVDIAEATIDQLRQWFSQGVFSAYDLTSCYLTRIEALNSRLRSVTC